MNTTPRATYAVARGVVVARFAYGRIADIVKSSTGGFALTEDHQDFEPGVGLPETLAERVAVKAIDTAKIYKKNLG